MIFTTSPDNNNYTLTDRICRIMNQLIDQTSEKSHQPWHGHLNLVYAHQQDATQVIYTYNQAPLKFQRPFYPEGKEFCHTVMLHTAGGVVGGDQLSYNFHLQPHSKSLITTATASKIYRSNGPQARQTMQTQIDAGAYLEYLPQETIIFNGANYRQDLKIDLGENATLLLWEITRFGRSARGEKFLTGEWRSNLEIYQQNIPIWIDRQYLKGGTEIIDSPLGLAGQPIVASLIYLGQSVTPEIVDTIRQLSQDQNKLDSFPQKGVTRLTTGLLCRYRGNSTPEARNWFIAIWQLLRLHFWQRPSCPPRVWPL